MDAGVKALVANVTNVLVNPAIELIFAAGLVVFVFGVVEYLSAENNIPITKNANRDNGRRHMLYGLVGMFVMSVAYAIIQILANTVGTKLP